MTTEFTHELPLGTTLTAHEHIGFELGWDYAHHGLTPPAPYDQEPSSLRHGLLAGQAAFGTRTLLATRHVRKWLQLRLHAWLRGRSVELVQVTPNHLQQIEVSHCPITRVALSAATLESTDASVDRVRNDAGYAAGNLANVMCRNLVSVDWQGYLYDCDFNQQLGLALPGKGRPHLADLLQQDLLNHPVRVADHCYGCTAGQGSSCGGALHA